MPETQSVVTKDMTVADILEKVPAAADIMQTYGLHCFGCHVNVYESLEMGALGHGMDESTVEAIVRDINEAANGSASAVQAAGEQKADISIGDVGREEKEGHEHAHSHEHESSGTLELSDLAAQKILEIMKQQGKENQALRVGVVAGGCAGYTYNMDFEKTPNHDDIILEKKGVTLHVDEKSMKFLGGSVIDYVESLQGAGFKFNNPNTHASCGCGKSFT